jgi:hypothetical protein
VRVKPKLQRILGDRDWVAKAILERVPQRIDQRFIDSLDPSASLALGRYGIRLATLALRERSAAVPRALPNLRRPGTPDPSTLHKDTLNSACR